MESLRYLYRIGPGPSSSHTIGPSLASEYFKNKYKDADLFKVTLHGALALTGKGHLTDKIIKKTMGKIETEVIFDYSFLKYHPNAMIFKAYKDNKEIGTSTIYSIGGGSIVIEGDLKTKKKNVYPHKSFSEIKKYLAEEKISLVEYVKRYDVDIKDYLSIVLDTMFASIKRGLKKEGLIPGKLHLEKVAKQIYQDALSIKGESQNYERNKMLITSYAYAVSEENASGEIIATAPTCGAAGVFSSLLYFFYENLKTPKEKLIEALMVGGVFGNLIKENATISGAKGGCQAEVGTACSMAAAGISYLLGLSTSKIEYASEVAMEHHLGLTCDPVLGYVQIPCIERNGVAALRAYDAALYGKYIANHRINRVSFDNVVNVMKITGEHLKKDYKETALGGLAKEYKEKIDK